MKNKILLFITLNKIIKSNYTRKIMLGLTYLLFVISTIYYNKIHKDITTYMVFIAGLIIYMCSFLISK